SQPVNLNNSLSLITEYFQEWIVNQNQFKGNIPKICGMTLSNNLSFFIERKLFTLNAGHAIAAYLGLIKKYHTTYESISDNIIKIIVKGAMEE
ncbi:mannitol-1-phosphate 5-dehydrogenase, partial [Buchnera aphidicola]|nr:mannitol-1-phosphate 5-dehydrogenase [Buchnera aphidicola]